MSTRSLTAAVLLVGSALGVLGASSSPAAAAPPDRDRQVIVHIDCTARGDFGAVRLGLEHISTDGGAPGGDMSVWAPNADPETDPPALGGYNPEITRDGMILTGEIPLRASGDDIVGWSSYEVTFATAGPAEVETVKGPLVEYDVRYNQRFRNVKERTPLTASGTLSLPRIGTVALTACVGTEVVEQITMTQPATVVGAGRYPFGFSDGELCEARSGTSTTALLGLTGGEAVIVILREGQEDAVAFGTVFPDMTRTSVTGSVPMVGPDGELMGEATLDATLRVVDRANSHDRDGTTAGAEFVEHVVASGTIEFDVTYAFTGCEGVRARERTISH